MSIFLYKGISNYFVFWVMKKKIVFTIDTNQLERDLASDVPFDTIQEKINLLLGNVQELIMKTMTLSPYARARVEMVTGNIWKTIEAFEKWMRQCDQWSDEWCETVFSLWMMCFQVRDDEKALMYWKMLVDYKPKSEQQEEWCFLASINVSLHYYNQGKVVQALDMREKIASLPDSSSVHKQHAITLAREHMQMFYNQYTSRLSPFIA